MKNQHNNQLLLLTIATFLLSTSGSLGRFISMPTEVIIWWRCSLACLLLFIYCKYKKFNIKIQSKKDFYTLLFSTLFLGVHWVTYFYALKLSNVALGMLSIFTFPVITALIEPLFTKKKLIPIHILLALMILLGIYILAPEFDFKSNQVRGILFGVFSAVCYSIRNLMLKKTVSKYNGTSLMMYQTFFLTVLLLPALFIKDSSNITTQYPYIILLAVVTTAIGHSLFVSSFKHFSVSTASIVASTQPVFGIIIAYFFLNETPTLNTFIGGSLIIATVIIESIRSKKN